MIRFENRIGRTVLPAPPVSAASTTCEPRRPASCRPRRPPLSRRAPRPRPPLALSLSLSPVPPQCGAHPSGPLLAAPLKTEPLPAGRNFFSPARYSSHPSTPERRTLVPIAQSSTPSERHCRPPPSGECPSSCSIHQSTAASSPRWSLSSCRTSPRSLTTTGAIPPPLIITARHRLHRLTVGTPFWCTPALSSLPGTFLVAPSISLITPYRHRATARVGRACRFSPLGWAGQPGRGPAGVSADRMWQAATPQAL
jgi:hypothetical protein